MCFKHHTSDSNPDFYIRIFCNFSVEFDYCRKIQECNVMYFLHCSGTTFRKKIVIIIIIIIIILVITYMYGIWNYLSEPNHVSRVYSVAAILFLQILLLVLWFRPWNYVLHFYVSTFRSMFAVPNVAVFRSSLISCFLLLLMYCLSDFEMVPVAPAITGITFAFTFHMRRISIMRSLRFKIFSASFLITFLSPGIAKSIDSHVPCLLPRIVISGLVLGICRFALDGSII